MRFPLAILLALVPAPRPAQAAPIIGRVFMYRDMDQVMKEIGPNIRFYPKDNQGESARVTLRFVGSVTGEVEAHSIKVLKNPIPAFATAARHIALVIRFVPGTIHGLPVRVLMERRFDFRPGTVSCGSTINDDGIEPCVDSTSAGSKP
ncbi:MAG: hypothetical protein ABI765_08845 [Gemmatimonadota bacterium]